ncbi:cache domain-containing sensor histidine kinase [Paenibacillus xerothermodurans]|uniref:histidine kinase n=1 Tax=Paenibacillus xerothermodurans TaxID=1977292 RepID=A0A2W1N7D6_PAEXE|nr:sensor histidine kinase [Paenibacillus xerothermodurans]PZE20529.1 sensor histidine kinase [Paenibacillus xerothermodurans]
MVTVWNKWWNRWTDHWRGRSIQVILTVAFTLITILVMLLVSVILYNKFAQTAEQNTYLSNQQIVEQVNYNLDIYLRGMADVFELVDEKIRATPSLPNVTLGERLTTILDTRQDIVSMALFTADGELVTGLPSKPMRVNTRLTEQSWFQAARESPNHLSFSLPHIQNLYKGQYTWVVSLSKGINITRNGRNVPAVLMIDVNFKTIDELCRRVSLGKKGYVYIIDESGGNMIYHPQQQLIYAGLKYENVEQALKYTYGSYLDESNGEKRLITIETVDNIGWKIIGVSYMDETVTTRKEISGFITWLLVFVLLFVLLVSAYISAKISQPLKRLDRSMRQVEQGIFDIHIAVGRDDEVGRLSRSFNVMVARIRQLMEANVREQEAKRKSELEVLQSQISPHFLYNTLNSVVRMAGTGKSEDVITMITALSKFFRISLSRGQSVIAVGDELEHVRNYMIIQQNRYKNKFDFKISAEEETLTCKTIKLILQPLVENAIYHGIEQMADPGYIQISAAIVDHKLLFEVTDNGLGMPEDKLSQLLTAGTSSAEGSGVGVRNVHERLRLTYGAPYGLEIASELEEGTCVKAWIPVIRDEDAGE